MLRHTVVFKLKHAAGSAEEREFLQAAQRLANIPGVNNFECLRQISDKNNFDFGLAMQFESTEDYQAYNTHADHARFVETRWLNEVSDFMEIDYTPYE